MTSVSHGAAQAVCQGGSFLNLHGFWKLLRSWKMEVFLEKITVNFPCRLPYILIVTLPVYRRAVIGRACRKFFLGNSLVRPISLLPLYFDLWNFNCRVKGNNWCSLLPVLDVNYTLMPLWLLISLLKNFPFFAGVKGSRSYYPTPPPAAAAITTTTATTTLVWVGGDV